MIDRPRVARPPQVSVSSTLCHCGAEVVSVVPTKSDPPQRATATLASLPTSDADESPKLLSQRHKVCLCVAAAAMCAVLILRRHGTLQRIQTPGFHQSWNDRQCLGQESEQSATSTSAISYCTVSQVFTIPGFVFPGRKGNNISLNQNTVIAVKTLNKCVCLHHV